MELNIIWLHLVTTYLPQTHFPTTKNQTFAKSQPIYLETKQKPLGSRFHVRETIRQKQKQNNITKITFARKKTLLEAENTICFSEAVNADLNHLMDDFR